MRPRRIVIALLLTAAMALGPAALASAHVHGITPLLTLARECGVTELANTGANRSRSDVITGLIPRDVGQAPIALGDGGFTAPVGCAGR